MLYERVDAHPRQWVNVASEPASNAESIRPICVIRVSGVASPSGCEEYVDAPHSIVAELE